ncbi:MAG: hypothetical protein AAGC57_02010 [Pseudomonadota bacterium]
MRSLIVWIGILTLGLAGPMASACEPWDLDDTRRSGLFERLADAPDETAGRAVAQEIWAFWSEAPDAKSQELMDRIYDRRRWKDFKAAESAARELTEYCPEYSEGWNQLATMLFFRDRLEASLDAIVRTLALEPDHFGALSGRAVILMRQGQTELGQIALRQAVAIHPWLSERHLLIPEPGQKL